MTAQERRRSPRTSTVLDVTYGAGDEFADGRIVDVGMGGFGLVGKYTYPVGSQLELRFRTPGGQSATIQAVVCYSNQNRMGVQVIRVSPEGATILKQSRELASCEHS